MYDIKGQLLCELRDKLLWQRAIEKYAKLQVKEVEYADKLISVGVPDRRLGVLKAEIEKYIDDMCAAGLDTYETSRSMFQNLNCIEGNEGHFTIDQVNTLNPRIVFNDPIIHEPVICTIG